MVLATNGVAIVNGEVVPKTEAKVLRALVEVDRPATVLEISSQLVTPMSDSAIYTLLGRLAEQRGLVTREEVVVMVQGTRLRRIFWTPHEAAKEFFKPKEVPQQVASVESPA